MLVSIKKNILPILGIILLASIYIVFAWIINKGNFQQTPFAYYDYLLSSLFHGRFSVTPFLSATDLSFVNDKWYMYWGPAPSVFVSPFYLFARTKTSDVLYTLVAGILNISFFYLVLNQFNKVFKLNKNLGSIMFVLVSFALMSPNFYLSLQGRIWHTNQVVAVTFLLTFLLFYLKFLGDTKKLFYLFIACIFVNLAVLSRYTMIFYFSLFIPFLWDMFCKKNWMVLKKSLVIISCVTILFFGMLFIYNYARFGNIFETGASYMDIRSSANVFEGKDVRTSLFGTKYIWHNFQTYFLNHLEFLPDRFGIKIDKEGNSVFSIYPILILLPLLFLKKNLKDKKYVRFLSFSLLGVVLPVLLYFLNFLGTGWAQFGARYWMDIIPLLFLLLLAVVEDVPAWAKILILVYGVYVNFSGAILFYA